MRRLWIGVVVVGLAVALAAPAFATGKQVTCWERAYYNRAPFCGVAYDGMRFQTLIEQTEINYEGEINQVEFEIYSISGFGATVNNYKLMLAHCGSSRLSTTFAYNYKGTPVTVADLSTFTIPNSQGWFPLGMTTTTFDYNNADNLLIEIKWSGDNGQECRIYTGYPLVGNYRVLARDPNATTGYGDGLTYYIRLSFGVYPGVTSTSLGRVKALYE